MGGPDWILKQQASMKLTWNHLNQRGIHIKTKLKHAFIFTIIQEIIQKKIIWPNHIYMFVTWLVIFS
jgi:hypothetical protein